MTDTDLVVPRSRGYFPGPGDPPAPPRFAPRPLRIDVTRYRTMHHGGAFADEPWVELIDGAVIESCHASPSHDGHAGLLADCLRAVVPGGWAVRERKTLTLRAQDSQPTPDAAVLNRPLRAWAREFPTAANALLVAEVADVSLRFDRTRKARIYAAAGLSPYWIVNLPERVLEVRTDPHAPAGGDAGYRTLHTYKPEETVEFTLADQAFTLPVAELLPAENAAGRDDGV